MLKRALSLMSEIFTEPLLDEAQFLVHREYVLTIRMSDGLLKARVMGKNNRIHDVFLDFKLWPKKPGQCTCSYKHNCEHVAAAILALQAKEKLDVLPAFQDRLKTLPPIQSTQFTYENSETLIDEDEVTWYSRSHLEQEGIDFFSYELGMIIQDQEINLVPWIAAFIERYDISTLEHWTAAHKIRLPIGEGRVVELQYGRVKPLITLLLSLGTSHIRGKKSLQLLRYQLLLMQEAEQAIHHTNQRWHGTSVLQSALKKLLDIQQVRHDRLPVGLKAELRDYQYAGFQWLHCLREAKFGGVLADDMGLGKTIQTLAFLQSEKEQGRLNKACLIIAPTSVIGNWVEECQRFTPELKVLIYHGNQRYRGDFNAYDLIISTYGLVQRDKQRFTAHKFYYLILDEAQFIKNTQTKTRQIIQQLQAENRLCLTGTPLENHLGELWSLFHFLTPGLLGDRKSFHKLFRLQIEKNADKDRLRLLMHRIQPFLLRRTKNQVVKELPPKTEMTQWISLDGKQRDLYETIRMSTEREVREAIAKKGLNRNHIVLLDALLKLRQICCDPRLLKLPKFSTEKIQSAKLEACMELLDNLMSEGRRVLIFSQFTSMLALIEDAIQLKGYDYLKLTGQTKHRQSLIADFQARKAPIFLISLKAGGTGLNLTEADTVIHFDPWWNPAVEDQATGRSHRIGQSNSVFVYRLITKGTVEEAITVLQAKKKDLFDAILNQETSAVQVQLTEQDIDLLFAPIED